MSLTDQITEIEPYVCAYFWVTIKYAPYIKEREREIPYSLAALQCIGTMELILDGPQK